MTCPCVVCCKRPRGGGGGAEGSPGRYSRVSGEQGTVVPGFYKLQDRMGDVAVGHAIPVPWEGNGSWPWGSHVGSSWEGKDCRQDYEQLFLARSEGWYKAIMFVLGHLSEGKSKREHKEGAVGEGQKLSTDTMVGEGQKLSTDTPAGEGQKLSTGWWGAERALSTVK